MIFKTFAYFTQTDKELGQLFFPLMGNKKGGPCAKFQTCGMKFQRFMAKNPKFGYFDHFSGFSSQKIILAV